MEGHDLLFVATDASMAASSSGRVGLGWGLVGRLMRTSGWGVEGWSE